ncbi:MAG: hypothetical protein ACRDG7_19480 [Candidatus Limnocylindria bacterium]
MIVCITGGKGGPGTTVLATHLASTAASMGRSCLLVDLDPFGGDIGAYLNPGHLDPRRGVLPLLRLERAGVSQDALQRETQIVAPALTVLLGLLRPDPDLFDRRIGDLLGSAQRIAEVVVADLGRVVVGSPSLEALENADEILLAARPDLQGALAAGRALSVLDQHNSRVVATRVRKRRAADVTELAEALGRPIAASVPELNAPARPRPSRRLRRELSRLIEDLSGTEGAMEIPPDGVSAVVAS